MNKLNFAVLAALATVGIWFNLVLHFNKNGKIHSDFILINEGWSNLKQLETSIENIFQLRLNLRPKCRLPETPIWPAYFSKWKPKEFSGGNGCAGKKNLIKIDGDKIIKLTNSTCSLLEIIRGSNDSSYSFSPRKTLKTTQKRKDEQAFIVTCDNFWNFGANIPTTITVREKIKHWKKIPRVSQPYSVLILGIDTISRSHVFRSLPNSLKILQKLKFLDFKAYHSMGPSTLPNFMPLLMGLSRQQVRATCAPTWDSTFDDCPFIWKNFSNENYITAYIEDGDQTFNWGGQSGFENKPTDYYLHQLFLALEDYEKIAGKKVLNKKFPVCTSRDMNVPEFMVDYTTRWLSIFGDNLPFFYMNWFEDPFHQNIDALPNFDAAFSKFLEFLASREKMLKKTLIIFLSDHGDRFNFFESGSVESYFERGLPPLFIRIPDQLRLPNSELVRNFEINSLKLTTAFDLHQMLSDILKLGINLDLKSNNIEKDRYNLITEEVPFHRACAAANIPKTHCLCNLKNSLEKRENTQVPRDMSEKLLEPSLNYLNLKLARSNFSKLCERWQASKRDIVYATVVDQSFRKKGKNGTEHHQQIILSFWAHPGDARFEAKLDITTVNCTALLKDCPWTTKPVDISRVNKYGEQSWCIPKVTDEDKEMKEFCTCLSPAKPLVLTIV